MAEIIKLNRSINSVVRNIVEWSILAPSIQGAITYQLISKIEQANPQPLQTRRFRFTPKADQPTRALYIKTLQPKKGSTSVHFSKLEERLYVKNSIASPNLDLLEEEEPETLEDLFDILVALHKGKITQAHTLFRELIASRSGLLSKFNHHLRHLNTESEEQDAIEFGADIVKTKKALFAIAYNGKNAQGKPNKYFSTTAMKGWFADLGSILKEEETKIIH